MNQLARTFALSICVSAAGIGIVGCSAKVLDYRNAEISSGKIYAGGANTPFTGKVTNLPITVIRIGGMKPLLDALTNVTRDKAYSEAFMASALATIISGSRDVGILCDVQVDEGFLDGEVICASQGTPVLKADFVKGSMDGDLVLNDPRTGKVAAEATTKGGQLNGKSKVFDAATGKVLHTVNWENGSAVGLEKYWDKNGKLLVEASLKGGKYDGDFVVYDTDGKVKLTTVYSNGVPVRKIRPEMSDAEVCMEDKRSHYERSYGNQPPAPLTQHGWEAECGVVRPIDARAVSAPAIDLQTTSALESCTDKWISAHRKERGEDAPVSQPQLQEWEQWCKQGKTPG